MDRDATFISTKTELQWERSGAPWCEHPRFAKDGNAYGPDDDDWYCVTCGAIRVGRDGAMPAPRGERHDGGDIETV